jgi:peptide/nickel transport system ATP-binding protein
VQAQVLNLMQDLQDRFGVTYLFISHDLAVVDLVCDEVIVLQHGRIVEHRAPRPLFQHPQHPYTQRLLAAAAAARRRSNAAPTALTMPQNARLTRRHLEEPP